MNPRIGAKSFPPEPLFLALQPTRFYTQAVLQYLHALGGAMFFLLAGSLYVAYVLLKNGIGDAIPEWWLSVADLPTVFTGCLYGGLSFYRSLLRGDVHHRGIAATIAVPLLIAFFSLLAVNFGFLNAV